MQNFKIIAFLLLGYFWLVGEEGGEGFVDNKGFLSHRRGFSWGLWLRLTNNLKYVLCCKYLVQVPKDIKLVSKGFCKRNPFWKFCFPHIYADMATKLLFL